MGQPHNDDVYRSSLPRTVRQKWQQCIILTDIWKKSLSVVLFFRWKGTGLSERGALSEMSLVMYTLTLLFWKASLSSLGLFSTRVRPRYASFEPEFELALLFLIPSPTSLDFFWIGLIVNTSLWLNVKSTDFWRITKLILYKSYGLSRL